MKRSAPMWLAVLMCLVASTGSKSGVVQAARSSHQAVDSIVPLAPTPEAFVRQYCVTCHNGRLRTGGLAFETHDLDVGENAEVWEKVLRKLRAGAMPPAGSPRPDQSTFDAFLKGLEKSLDEVAAARPNPGRSAFHRLNRAEYGNAIRDLLALDIDVTTLLPSDNASYGFDNIADIQSVSPVLLERYLSAARRISELAIGDPAIGPRAETYRVTSDLTQHERLDGLSFGTRGGMLIRHNFPLSGEYVIKLRLLRNLFDQALGVGDLHQIEVGLDGERVRLFNVGRQVPEDRQQVDDEFRRYRVVADADLEVRLFVAAGPRAIGVTFIKRPSAYFETPRIPRLKSTADPVDPAVQPHIDSLSISGPYSAAGAGDTPSRRRIFVCRPAAARDSEARCAKEILSLLARRAYRRPVTAEDVQILLAFYNDGRATGNFDHGIQMALRRILVSAEFLFRPERDPQSIAPDSNYRIDDLALASRLSFFLWSSIPDDELLQVAERGRLKEPRILAEQVRRMLSDSRSEALVRNFAGQWLLLRNVPSVKPDPILFPDFDENLRQAFRTETELLFKSVLDEDRSVLDLLRADYTYINERLARHYHIPNVYGSHFRRVALTDPARHGLLGHGSILTLTSFATRTSPVLRGKWILENILGAPPPPPPPEIPELEPRDPEGRVLSMREQMVRHRSNAICASCHAKMDPLGLPLENYDAVGRWRARDESETAIDASGVLPNGITFEGPAGLLQVLLQHPEEFVSTVTEKLLIYGLGRGLQYYDASAVRRIVSDAARNNYSLSSLIQGIVESVPFQQRRSEP